MKITLKKLSLRNFKGAKSLTIDFNDITNISGANGTFKTTIFDAFTFLMFSKDSLDRKEFQIKTLDKNGKALRQVEHEVEGILFIQNGIEYTLTLKKTLKEKWIKPRGKTELEFQGHETTYFIDSVPYTMKDYNAEIEKLCPESIFKLITNPRYFPSLNWSVQRKTLIALAGGEIGDQDVLEAHPEFRKLFDKLSGKTLELYKKQVANEKTRIKAELEQIPVRIDEANRQIPAFILNTEHHPIEIKELEDKITAIDKGINDKSVASKKIGEDKLNSQRLINTYNGQLMDLAFKVKQSLKKDNNNIQGQVNTLKDRKELLDQSLATMNKSVYEQETIIMADEKIKANLLETYNKIKAETFPILDPATMVCPTCKRQWDEDTYTAKEAEFIQEFNIQHSRRLQENISLGKALKETIETRKDRLNRLQKDIEETKEKVLKLTREQESLEKQQPILTEDQYDDITSNLLKGIQGNKDEDRQVLLDQYKEIETKLITEGNKLDSLKIKESKEPASPDQVSQELINEKSTLREDIDKLKKEIQITVNMKEIKIRIEQLMSSQETLAQELANFEKDESVMNAFTKIKIDAVEKKINSMFTFVKFKMFNILINGAEEETCELTVDGVPYSDLNNAMRICSGLDVISTISKHENAYAPIFCDNAEACNSLPEMDAQMIKLFVTNDKTLKIT